jgi:hypothetical protein
MQLIQLLIISSLAIAACGSSEKTAKQEKSTEPTTNSTTMTAPNQENKYRLIVSFISIGEGTDPDARKIMDGVIEKWNQKTGKSIEMVAMPWGREGEVDFCFRLNELSTDDQVTFVKDLKKSMEGRSLIQFAENQEGRFKN